MLAVNFVSEQSPNLSTTETRLLEAYRQHDHETLAEIVGQSLLQHEQQKPAAGDLAADEAEVLELYRKGKALQAKAAAAPAGDPGKPTGAPKPQPQPKLEAIDRIAAGQQVIDTMIRMCVAEMLVMEVVGGAFFDPQNSFEELGALNDSLYSGLVKGFAMVETGGLVAAQQAATWGELES